jgi:hypothetical protein
MIRLGKYPRKNDCRGQHLTAHPTPEQIRAHIPNLWAMQRIVEETTKVRETYRYKPLIMSAKGIADNMDALLDSVEYWDMVMLYGLDLSDERWSSFKGVKEMTAEMVNEHKAYYMKHSTDPVVTETGEESGSGDGESDDNISGSDSGSDDDSMSDNISGSDEEDDSFISQDNQSKNSYRDHTGAGRTSWRDTNGTKNSRQRGAEGKGKHDESPSNDKTTLSGDREEYLRDYADSQEKFTAPADAALELLMSKSYEVGQAHRYTRAAPVFRDVELWSTLHPMLIQEYLMERMTKWEEHGVSLKEVIGMCWRGDHIVGSTAHGSEEQSAHQLWVGTRDQQWKQPNMRD